MLTAEERQDIEAEMALYPTKEAVRIGAMKIVQRHRGWVCDESIRDIGEMLSASPADLDSLATFYNLIFRKPVGRHVIMLCDSVSCWIMGYERVREHLVGHLGIGFGDHALTTGLHSAAHRLSGGVRTGAGHDPGQQSSWESRSSQNRQPLRGVQVDMTIEKPLTKDIPADGQALDLAGYERAGGYQALRNAVGNMTPQQVQEEVKNSGLRGRGGAGFPTGVKWSFTPMGSGCSAAQVRDRQRRRDGAGHLQGSFPHGGQSPPAHRGTDLGGTHGFGSFCSATQAEGSSSTIGRERRVNPVLTLAEDRYVSDLLAGLDVYPAYYAHMGPANAAGPAGPDLSAPRRADAAELRRRIDAGEWVVDLRARRAFAAGHVAGTLSFDLDGSFATYLGWLIPWGTPLTLLGQTPEQVAEAQRELVRIGIDRPVAAATGHPDDWPAAGRCAAIPSRTSPTWNRSAGTVRWSSWTSGATRSGTPPTSAAPSTFPCISCPPAWPRCPRARSGCTARRDTAPRSPRRSWMPRAGRSSPWTTSTPALPGRACR